MIYPKKISSKKSNIIMTSLMGFSVLVGIILFVINKLTTPDLHWAALSNAGIIYCWVVVIYSVNRNINIGGHVVLQTIALSALATYIDYVLGFEGWSINIAIPILIIIANTTMLVLTIVSSKKYIRYGVFQFVILLFSGIPIYLIYKDLATNPILCYVASWISLLNLVITLVLSAKDFRESIVRNFHF